MTTRRPKTKARRSAARPARPRMTDTIRSVILARQLSAYAVARQADIDPSIVTRFMSGERAPSAASLDAICECLGLELRETRRGRPAAAGTARPEVAAPDADVPDPDVTG